MPHAQKKITDPKRKKQAVVIDERTRPPEPTVKLDLETANKPVRTIIYVDVTGMEHNQMIMLLKEINDQYTAARGGIHYIVPVRDGKVRSDIVFENEFMDVVEQVCEIKDNKIVMKNSKDVHVIRERV